MGDPAGNDETVGVTPLGTGEAEAPPIPRELDRYRIDEVLGQGGLGLVYRGWDPQLSRPVAIKVIRCAGPDVAEEHERLRREARALAALSHPHVVSVFDVGRVAPAAGRGRAGVFVVMELVEGTTLSEWLANGPHPWPEVRRLLLEAGEGLAAAHRAGLVHRDFKPANVMVDARGGARVLDFGIAATVDSREVGTPTDREPSWAPSPASVSARLTETGTVMGTPAYMAPEQRAAKPVSPASDQFSFCMTLFEAVRGRRPTSVPPSKDEWRRPNPRAIDDVPVSVRRAIERGLAIWPEDRWPSMTALLQALRPSGRPRRLALAVGVAGVLLGAWSLGTPVEIDTCERPPSAQIPWTAARADAMAKRFAEVSPQIGPDTARAVHAKLDEHWAAHGEVLHEVCAGDRADVRFDARRACLARQRRQLDAQVAVLLAADHDVVTSARHAAATLEPPSACLADDLAPVAPLDPRRAAAIEDALAFDEQARALSRAGKPAEALAPSDEAVRRLRTLNDPGTLARVLVENGDLHQEAGHTDLGRQALEEAHAIAVRLRDDRLAADAALVLVTTAGNAGRDHSDSKTWMRHAEAAIARLPDADFARQRLLTRRATIDALEGRLDAGEATAREVLRLAERSFGPDHFRSINPRLVLARIALMRGEMDEAIEILERTLTIAAETFGTEHREYAQTLERLANAYSGAGRFGEAAAAYRRAIEQTEATTPDRRDRIGTLYGELGQALMYAGEKQEALLMVRRAVELLEAHAGLDHPNTVIALGQLTAALQEAGDAEEAVRVGLQAIERSQGSSIDPVRDTGLHHNVGLAFQDLGQLEQARDYLQKSVDIATARFGPDASMLAYPLTSLGQVAAALGDPEQAVPLLERAEVLTRKGGVMPHFRGVILWTLARTLDALGREPERVATLAGEARIALEQSGSAGARDLADLQAWAETRDRRPASPAIAR